MSYSFQRTDRCNMCETPTAGATVLGRRLNTRQGLRPRRRVGVSTTVQRCRGCGLVFTNPRPVPQSVGQHYDLAPEEYWGSGYLNQTTDAHFVEEFRARWRGDHRPVALDVGAGLGHTMLALQRAGMDTWGIEPGQAFRERALQHPELDSSRLLHDTVETVDLPEARFDFINMSAVVEHFGDPAAAIERARSWLAPGGLILVAVPSADWLSGRLLNLAYRAQGLDYVTNVSPMHSPFHLYEFTARSFCRHGARVGYDVAGSRVYVGDTFMPRGLRRIARTVMERTGTGLILTVWLRTTVGSDGETRPHCDDLK